MRPGTQNIRRCSGEKKGKESKEEKHLTFPAVLIVDGYI